MWLFLKPWGDEVAATVTLSDIAPGLSRTIRLEGSYPSALGKPLRGPQQRGDCHRFFPSSELVNKLETLAGSQLL